LIFMLQGEAKGFGDFSDKQKMSAKCQLKFQEYRQHITCYEAGGTRYAKTKDDQTATVANTPVELGDLDCDTSNWNDRICPE
ncbi:MAG: hypothetical protein ABEJ03_03695, partial [Candidatus Nanohaloarchaea archaeon]